MDFWRYRLIFKPIYEIKYVYFEVYIFFILFSSTWFCEYILCIVYCTVYVYCMYTVWYAQGTIYCTHAYLQYTLYRLIYIFLIWLEIPPYQKSYTVQYLYNYTYCTYSVQCSSENKLHENYILFIYLFIYFIHLLDCFVLFRFVVSFTLFVCFQLLIVIIIILNLS